MVRIRHKHCYPADSEHAATLPCRRRGSSRKQRASETNNPARTTLIEMNDLGQGSIFYDERREQQTRRLTYIERFNLKIEIQSFFSQLSRGYTGSIIYPILIRLQRSQDRMQDAVSFQDKPDLSRTPAPAPRHLDPSHNVGSPFRFCSSAIAE